MFVGDRAEGGEGKLYVSHKQDFDKICMYNYWSGCRLMNRKKIHDELVAIVGSKWVSNRKAELFLYSWDFLTTEPIGKPDFVVMPKETEEVQAIVRLANQERIHIIPYVKGLSVGGLANPNEGGVVLDMKRMNKILEVEEDNMYAVIEGGVTQAQLKRYLNKYYPELRFSYTWAPPGTGILPGLLNYGMYDLSLRYGSGDRLINAIEVVLPTGEIAYFGSRMFSSNWLCKNPVPDLMGLFIGWQGTTGIITKAGIQLFNNFLHQKTYIVETKTVELGFDLQNQIAKADIADDITGENFFWAKAGEGYKLPIKKKTEDPELTTTITLTANTSKEMEAKEEILTNFCERAEAHFALMENIQMPVQVINDWDGAKAGSMQWIGAYMPNRYLAKSYRKSEKIYEKYGYSIQAYNRLMGNGHYGIIRFNACFWKKHDFDERKKVNSMLREIAKVLLESNGILYKPPMWAAEILLKRGDPAAVNLMRKIKRLLDPNRIMNPGKLGL
jgi:glycolate oxidase